MITLRRVTTNSVKLQYYFYSRFTKGHNSNRLLNDEIHKTENIEDELDFEKFNMLTDLHDQDLSNLKVKQKNLIVKRKYFNEKYPNFLSWSDKQQIKLLYNTNPEEWSVDRLSEAFPATPNVIQAIISSNFTKSPSKIINHDENVKNNWKLFKDRKLNLPKPIEDHIKQFSERTQNYNSKNYPPSDDTISVVPEGEFSKIISSYKELENKNYKPSKGIQSNNMYMSREDDTFLVKKINNTQLTLDQFQEDINRKKENKDILDEDEKIILLESTKDSIETKMKLMGTKYQENKSVSVEIPKSIAKASDSKQIVQSYKEYPEKIMIPKKLVKPGKTYKLNDCYYDYDGEFLYRVPGMCK